MGDFITEVVDIGLVDRLGRYVTVHMRDDATARRARPPAVAKPPADAAASQEASDVVGAARLARVLRAGAESGDDSPGSGGPFPRLSGFDTGIRTASAVSHQGSAVTRTNFCP